MTRTCEKERSSGGLFSLLLIYYWGIQYTQTTGALGESSGLVYYLYIAPISLYVLASSVAIILFGPPLGRPGSLVLAFGIIVFSVALFRRDVQTLLTVGLLAATVFVMLEQRVTFNVNLLNALFVSSIIAIAIAYAVGRSDYFVIPGYSLDSVPYRVSLFPQVATSAFFSALVLFANILNRRVRFRKPIVVLALYFLVFSGLRSVQAASVLAIAFLVLRWLGFFRTPRMAIVYLMGATAGFVVSLVFAPELLRLLSNVDERLSTFLARTQEGDVSAESIQISAFRVLLWSEHLRIAQDNPIFGIGTFDFKELSDTLGTLSTGSESFVTNMYVRVGLPVLILIAAFVSAIRRGYEVNGAISLVVGILLFIAMFAYGGFFAGYDFTFLSMLALLTGSHLQPLAENQRH